MSDRNSEIDRAWRKARRDTFFRDLRRSKLGIVVAIVLILLMVGAVTFSATPLRLRETVLGYGINEFSEPSDDLPEIRRVTVRLEDGRVVTLRFPKTELFRKDAPMKIAVYERVWGPLRHQTERFAGYAEKAP